MIVANGSTDVTTYFVLRDSTNHAPKTDVTITDIDLYYLEQGAAMAAKVDATALAAADSAHADNKGYHCGQGLYRIDWPDEAFNGGVGKRAYLIVVCTGVDTTFLEVELSPNVNTNSLTADVITAAGIADNAFANEHFANGALTSTEITSAGGCVVASIAANAITATAIAADAIEAAKIKDDAITAAKIAAGAIDNATFAADVGSTAYASNIIALAVRKVLDEIKLDHLVAVADSDDVADNSIIGKLASTDGDWSKFSDTTDSLQSIRDKLPTNLEDMSITDTTGLVALQAGQKVDVDTIKTQAVTCGAGVTVGAYVGQGTAAIAVDASGNAAADIKEINGTAVTGDGGATPWGPA